MNKNISQVVYETSIKELEKLDALPLQHRMHKFENCHEFIWYWGKNGMPFYGRNVFECKRQIEKFHPTIKPQELIEYFLKSDNYKNVLDLFGGSGSTLIACEQLDRNCYMMELDEKYASVILRRYVGNTGDAENVYCIRNGQKVAYADVVKQVDGSSDKSITSGLI